MDQRGRTPGIRLQAERGLALLPRPDRGVLSNINTGKQVGLAQAAREAFFERINDRAIQHTNYGRSRVADHHLQVAGADLKIDEAEYHARRLAALVDHKNYSNEPYTMRERAYCRSQWAGITVLP